MVGVQVAFPQLTKKFVWYLYLKGVIIVEAGWYRWGTEREYRYGDDVGF